MTRKKQKDQDAAPPKPHGWQSAAELEKVYVGDHKDVNRRLGSVRLALLRDVAIKEGCSEEEAAAVVDRYLIGRKKPRRGPEALAASPEAERLLGLTLRTEAAPPKPDCWGSSVELSRSHQGRPSDIARRLAGLSVELVADLSAAGYAQDAEALVGDHLIGLRKPARGQEVIAASPDAVRLAEDAGVIVHRTRGGISRGGPRR